MSVNTNQQLPEWRRQGIPTLESTDEQVREFMDRQINPLSARRRWHTQRAAENLWFYLGRQWILPRPELMGTTGAYHFSEVYRHSRSVFPRPVTNLVGPAVDNEVARLTRKEFVPSATTSKNDPEWMAAARLAQDLVRWEIQKRVWGDKREESAFNLCVDGLTIFRTWWDETDHDLSLVASPDAAMCPACQRKYASSQVPSGFATFGMPSPQGPLEMLHADRAQEVEETGEATAMHPQGIPRLRMTHCPFCEEPTQLQSYLVSPEEARDLKDPFDREFGAFVPRGEGLLDVVSIHEFYPENGGIGVEPHEMRAFGMMVPRPLEWTAARFPELESDLKPEKAWPMLQLNPLYADRSFRAFSERGDFGGQSAGYETYYNHARVRELIIDPQPGIPGLEKGAWFIHLVQGERVVRRELCVEIEGAGEDGEPVLVPRSKFHFARFKRIPRNFWAWTFVNDLKPLNRRLNELDAQIIDLRERGVPNIWIPSGVEVNTKDDVGGSLNVIEYDGAMTGWTPKEGIFPGVPLTGNEYMAERKAILEDARLVGVPQDIEIGNSPGSVKTTSGLMLLAEEASQARGPRERSLSSLYESAFNHVLQMNMALRKESASYETADESGTYEVRTFTGEDLLPNPKIKLDARAGYDQTLYNKEAAGEALDRGLYVIDSPAARDRLLDLLKLPKDVNEGSSLQVLRAEEAWTSFKRDRKVPVIDVSIDDPVAWYSVLAKRWFGDECREMQRTAGWEQLLPRIVGWEARKTAIEQAEAPAKAVYGSIPPDQWPAVFKQGTAAVQQASMQIQRAQVAFSSMPPEQQVTAPPPPAMPAPFPPPPTQPFLPDQPELAIYEVWMRMAPELTTGLRSADIVEREGGDSGGLGLLGDLVRFRAVVEAYRLLRDQQALAGAMPPGPAGAGGAPAGAPMESKPPGAPAQSAPGLGAESPRGGA